ncbi:MAG: SAM-dependent methyltransferase, partial [Clostridia bacterium]|nr:SAM-dependent methyltransferase [Clostridia bacterium]
MASLYDRPDLYDLTDKESKDKITLGHWETLFKGKNIQTVLDVSIGTGGLTLPMTDMGIALSGTDLSEKRRIKNPVAVLSRNGIFYRLI